MSAVNSIKKRVAAFMADPNLPAQAQYPDGSNSGTGYADVEYSSNSSEWGISQDRKRVWDELDQMDRTDEIVSTGLDVIAACATGYEPTQEDSFTWRFEDATPDPKAVELLQRIKEQLDLGTHSNQIVRAFVKGGAEYRELVVNDQLVPVRFKSLPSYQIWPNLDELGNKVPGYEQRKVGTKPGGGIQFEEWQIVPFLYNSADGVFGRGLMESARGTYGRLRTVEDGMVAARIIRAYDRLKHKVPVPMGSNPIKQKEIIDAYKSNFTVERVPGSGGLSRSRRKPMGVATDIFIPDDGSNKGDVTSIVAHNAQLKDIDDVQYLRERLLIAIKVPRTYLNLGTGNEGALTDSGTATEDVQFARTLRQIQAVLRRGLKELATVALFFQGFDVDALGVRVDMPRVNTENFMQASVVQLNMAKAAQALTEVLGPLPPEIIAKEFMSLSDDDREILVSALKTNKEPVQDDSGDYDGPTLDQLARSIARLKVRTNSALGSKRSAIGESEAFRIAQNALLDALAA